MLITLLSDFRKHRETIEDYKKEWLYDILSKLDIDIDKLDALPSDLANQYLINNKVLVSDYPGLDAIQIEAEVDDKIDIVGELVVSSFLLKRDTEEILYYEITIECWSIFDES